MAKAKKAKTFQIRLEEDLLEHFHFWCEAHGQKASDVIRKHIRGLIESKPMEPKEEVNRGEKELLEEKERREVALAGRALGKRDY